MNYDIVWRNEPEQVWISCEKIDSGDQPFRQMKEIIVHFMLNGNVHVAFVPERFVDSANKRLSALIVAEYGDDLLVDIPAETLTAGSRLRVTAAERDAILIPKE